MRYERLLGNFLYWASVAVSFLAVVRYFDVHDYIEFMLTMAVALLTALFGFVIRIANPNPHQNTAMRTWLKLRNKQ